MACAWEAAPLGYPGREMTLGLGIQEEEWLWFPSIGDFVDSLHNRVLFNANNNNNYDRAFMHCTPLIK
jgi:hypothetical protein